MLLPGSVPGSLEDSQAGQDHNLRRAGTRTPGSRGFLNRDKDGVDVDLDASHIKSAPMVRAVGSAQRLLDSLKAQELKQAPVAEISVESTYATKKPTIKVRTKGKGTGIGD